MKATSLVDPREWLEGGQLFDYFQEQVKALKKKKKLEIFRIFFLTERQKSKKTTKKVLKMHKDAGIKVFIARDNLPKSISAEIKPFVIYDDKVAIVGNVSKERQIPAGIKTIDDLNISKLNNLFDQVKTLHSDKF